MTVYVGESHNNKHRFVVPTSCLKYPLFQDLLRHAEEEYRFTYPTGGLTIPCSETAFLCVMSLQLIKEDYKTSSSISTVKYIVGYKFTSS